MAARVGRVVLVAAVFAIGLVGCSEPDTIGKTLTVSGKVAIDGRPLENGSVVFHPDEAKDNKAKISAQGSVQGGNFTLTSTSATTSKPGAPPGWYKVTITTNVPMGGGMQVAADPTKFDPKSAIPKTTPIGARFTDSEKTPLSVEVKDGATYDLKAESK